MKFNRILLFQLLLITIICSCTNVYERQLKNEAISMESIVDQLKKYDLGPINEIELAEEHQDIEQLIGYLKTEYALCAIDKYQSGISFWFNCRKTLNREVKYSDRAYYLIKLLDRNEEDSLLGFPQFRDCSIRPEKLSNNWYFIRSHINCD